MKKLRLYQQPIVHRGVGGAQNHLPQHQQGIDGGVCGLKPSKPDRPLWVGQQLHLPPMLGGVGAVAKRLNGNPAKLDKPYEIKNQASKQDFTSTCQSSLMLHGERTRPLFACKTDRSGRDTLDSAIINVHRANKTVARSDILSD